MRIILLLGIFLPTVSFSKEHNFFHKIGFSTRIEYTQISPIRYHKELYPVHYAEAHTARSVTVLELMLGKTEKVYFYAQARFSSFFPYNQSFDYIGTGKLSGGVLLGLGGKIYETEVGGIYLNWGLVYDSKVIDAFANYPYFDNEFNVQFFRELGNNVSFVFSIYPAFGITSFDDGGDRDIVFTLRAGLGIGFLF